MDRSVENTRPRFVMGQSSFGKMLMLEDQFHDMNRGVWWAGGNFMDVDSALRFGVRIFIFVDEATLLVCPEYKPFVVGTWDDLDAIIGGGKVHVEDRGNCIVNPLQNLRCDPDPTKVPLLRLAMVSTRDFRAAFGMKRFTSLIPSGVWSLEV